MKLEALLESEVNKYEKMLLRYKDRYSTWREPTWLLFLRIPYAATVYGNKDITGPALVVFDAHTASPDGIILSWMKKYNSMVAKAGRDPMSWMARYCGAIMVHHSKKGESNGTKNFKAIEKQLALRLKHGQVVGVFTNDDINETKKRWGVVYQAVELEKAGIVPPVNYVTAVPIFYNRFSGKDKPIYIPFFKWPIPLFNKAELLVGNPFSLNDLPEEKRTYKGLTDRILEESASLRAKYL